MDLYAGSYSFPFSCQLFTLSRMLPIWLEEADHRDKAELGLGPCGLVRSQLANGLGAGVHCRKALTGWHVPLGDESVGSGQTFAIAGVVMNNDWAGVVLVELLAPVVAFFHGRAEIFEGQLS
jgi:hypothetical protein